MKSTIIPMKQAIICSMVLLASSVMAVPKVVYTYDNVGNMTKREIVLSSSVEQKSRQVPYSDLLSKKTIKIYPNPTDGFLHVEISRLDDGDRCDLDVFNLSGVNIIHQNVNEQLTDLDLSSQPNGVYVLKIKINDDKTSWKIIKK